MKNEARDLFIRLQGGLPLNAKKKEMLGQEDILNLC